MLTGLYSLDEAGRPATLDALCDELDGSPLLNKAFELQANGTDQPRRDEVCADLLLYFEARRERPIKQRLYGQLQAASDHETAKELLRQMQLLRSQKGVG